jgi:V8-like Glu-specific endopeptidase
VAACKIALPGAVGLGRIAILLTLCAACGAGPRAPDLDRTAEGIIGGMVDSGDPGIVALFAHLPGSSTGSLCTASLIAPTVLLTAAHCTLASEVGAGAVFDVIAAPALVPHAQILPVSSVDHDPAFDPNHGERGHDVGVAILAGPTALPTLPFARALGSLVGQTVRVIGYGVDDPAQPDSSGTKRTLTTTVSAQDGALLQVGRTGAQSCNGDSGGPVLALIGGQETIVGVTSFSSPDCTGGAFASRVDTSSAFLARHLAAPEPDAGVAATPDAAFADAAASDAGSAFEPDSGSTDAASPVGKSGGGCSCIRPRSSRAPLAALAVALLGFPCARRRSRSKSR